MCTIDCYVHRTVLFFSNPNSFSFLDILPWPGPVGQTGDNRKVLAFPIMQSYTSFQILIFCEFSSINFLTLTHFCHVIEMAMIFLFYFVNVVNNND